MNVAVAGPGLMGSQIGLEYALGGHHVVFLARDIDRGIERVNTACELAGRLGLWPEERIREAHDHIVFVPAVTDLNPATDLFVESIVEEAQAKIDLLKAAAQHMPTAILASNTSSLSIGRLGGWAGAPKRTIGTHYWNPPLLMPLVEVIAGPETDRAIVDDVCEILRKLRKRPVRIDGDVDGFVWNRLQLALLREAVWLVERGVASPAVVDEIVRDGLARRWRYAGPFATAALGGAATFTRVANNLWPSLSSATELTGLDQWLEHDPERLAALRQARDDGLIEELHRERRTRGADQAEEG